MNQLVKTKILLVEDNPGDARLIEEYLSVAKNDSYSMIHCMSLADAIDTIDKKSIDIILLDLGLPDSQGIETVIRMLDTCNTIPIVVLTGLDDEAIGLEAIQKGAQDYLVKGQLQENEISKSIKYCIERGIILRQLQDSKEKFRSLVMNSPNTIMRIDSEGNIAFSNYSFANMTPDELIGKSIYDFIPSEYQDVASKAINDVFKTGEIKVFEHLGIGEKDSILWYRNHAAPIIRDGNVISITIIITDISEAKQIELMKTELVSSVSHELRTPLTIIRESIRQVVRGVYGETTDGQKKRLLPCIEEVDRLARTVNELLDISKIHNQKISIKRELVDFVKLSKEVLMNFNVKTGSKNLDLKFSCEEKMISVYLDRDKIIQVLMNLIGNAVKFTEEGSIEIIINNYDNYIETIVSDTGIGIEKEDQIKIFERYYQTNNRKTTDSKSTGLGLPITKSLIELHKGQIWVESTRNEGSQFHFTLPLN